MKIRLLSLAFLAFCAACSAPKMAYKFDYHDYNAGRKAKEVKEEVASNPGPVAMNSETLVATAEVPASTPVESIETIKAPVISYDKTYENMTKKEQRELRREFKKEIKQIVKKNDVVESTEASKALEKDLKLAAIFGAVGIVGLILGGASAVFFYIGGIALIIGVVFFVRWLIRQ